MPMKLLVTGLFFCTLANVSAIIIRDDLDDSNYLVNDSDYPALVDLIERGDCIGTLVHEYYLLTVAHCAADLDLGDSLTVNGKQHSVADIILHPQWNQRRDEYDIALIRFTEPVKDVTPLPIYRGDNETGSIITIIGRGVTNTGLKGERGGNDDGQLRRCTNVVSSVDDHFIEIRFERPGEEGITPLEGVGAAGDSGCPAFIEIDGISYIAGLNSWGDGPRGVRVGQYGAFDYQTRVTQYLEWLDRIVDFPAPPQPVASLKLLEVGATRNNDGFIASMTLRFPSEKGKSYAVEQSTDMASWNISQSGVTGTGNIITLPITPPVPDNESIFFRVREE